jgi:hypothetical protein
MVVVIFSPHEPDCEIGGPSYTGFCPGCGRAVSRRVVRDA